MRSLLLQLWRWMDSLTWTRTRKLVRYVRYVINFIMPIHTLSLVHTCRWESNKRRNWVNQWKELSEADFHWVRAYTYQLQFHLSCSILVYNLNLVLSRTNNETFGYFINTTFQSCETFFDWSAGIMIPSGKKFTAKKLEKVFFHN